MSLKHSSVKKQLTDEAWVRGRKGHQYNGLKDILFFVYNLINLNLKEMDHTLIGIFCILYTFICIHTWKIKIYMYGCSIIFLYLGIYVHIYYARIYAKFFVYLAVRLPVCQTINKLLLSLRLLCVIIRILWSHSNPLCSNWIIFRTIEYKFGHQFWEYANCGGRGYGFVIKCVKSYGFIIECVKSYGFIIKCVKSYGFIIKCVRLYEFIIKCVKSYAFIIKFVKSYGFIIKCVKSYGFIIKCVKSYGFIIKCVLFIRYTLLLTECAWLITIVYIFINNWD